MRCGEVLASLALRRLLARAPQPAGAPPPAEPSKQQGCCVEGEANDLTEPPGGLPDPEKLAEAVRVALERAWVGVECLLAGWALRDSAPGPGGDGTEPAAHAVRRLLEAVPLDTLDRADPEALGSCWRGLHGARQAGLLGLSGPEAQRLASRAAHAGEEDAGPLCDAEWRALARLGEELGAAGHGALCPLLRLRWRGREPLLVVLVEALARQALEAEAASFPGLLPGSSGNGSDGLGGLAELLTRHGEGLARFLDAARPGGAPGGADHFQAGWEHLRRGEYDRAVTSFTAALGLSGAAAEVLARRGEAYRLKGDHVRALADLDEAHRLDPADPRALFNRGLVHEFLGRAEEAVADYTACLRLEPDNALVLTSRGGAYLHRGDLEAALADLNRAVQLDPFHAPAYQRRGDVFSRQGEPDRAVAAYSQALRLTPFCPATYVKRGEAYRRKGQLDRAVADYSNALRLDPLHVAAYTRRAAAYRSQGRHQLALADLTAAARLDPDNGRVYLQRALTFRALNDPRSAVADFDRAVRLRPEDAEVRHERGLFHQAQGDADRALEDFTAAIALDPRSSRAYRSRGALLAGQGHLDRAIEDFTAAVLLAPGQAESYLDRASAWVAKGRLDEAVRDCDRAVERDPRLPAAFLLRGEAHAQQGAYSAAEEDFARALELDPRNAGAYRARGRTALARGEYARAVADLTHCLELGPGDAEAFFLRGRAHQALDRPEEALADFHRAVLLDPRHTPAYCNQRAFLHAARGEYDLALADYAIVLQLDPTNVAALAGREQALGAVRSGARPHAGATNGAAVAPRRPSRPATYVPRRKKKPSPAATDEVRAVGPTRKHRAVPTAEMPAAPETPDGVDAPRESPAPAGELPPDAPVAPPPSPPDELEEVLRVPPGEEGQGSPRALGPIERRAAREQNWREMEDRARRWAELRHKEHQAGLAEGRADEERPSRSGGGITLPVGRLLKVAALLLLLGGVGGAAYYFVTQREPRLDAGDVWKEFDADTAAANKKYRGKFVQVTGKVKVVASGKSSRLFFEAPEGGARWGIEVTLRPEQRKEVQPGQLITVRGRFAPRKAPDGNLTMSNCTLMEAH